MEFIPLEKYSNKNLKRKNKVTKQKNDEEIINKSEIKKHNKEVNRKSKPKPKPLPNKFEVKKVKNKYKEVLMKKKKKKLNSKKVAFKKGDDDNEEDVDNIKDAYDEERDDDDEKMDVSVDTEEENEEEEHEDEEDEQQEDVVEEEEEEEEEEENERKKLEDAIKKKRQYLDEKKKNRLFVKLKKKIVSEAQIKELHPDIRSVIFPRKKNSRWCWAVFASEERANEALQKLVKKTDIVVTKPNPREMVEIKREKKMKSIYRKKEVKKKLTDMWM